jgi:hypothetical protein
MILIYGWCISEDASQIDLDIRLDLYYIDSGSDSGEHLFLTVGTRVLSCEHILYLLTHLT